MFPLVILDLKSLEIGLIHFFLELTLALKFHSVSLLETGDLDIGHTLLKSVGSVGLLNFKLRLGNMLWSDEVVEDLLISFINSPLVSFQIFISLLKVLFLLHKILEMELSVLLGS